MRRIDFKKYKITFILISLVINLIVSISLVSKSINDVGFEIGRDECINNIGLVISETIYNSGLNKNDILILDYIDDELCSVSFDNYTINKYVSSINLSILNYIKTNNMMHEVPIFVNSSSFLLQQLSPKIPIVYTLLGNVIIDSDCLITSYGINNALIEVKMNILLNMKVLLPFKSEIFSVDREVTLLSRIIQGDIPSTYLGSNSINSVIPVK